MDDELKEGDEVLRLMDVRLRRTLSRPTTDEICERKKLREEAGAALDVSRRSLEYRRREIRQTGMNASLISSF